MATGDRVAAGLRGPVRRVETLDPDGRVVSVAEYDEAGGLARNELRNPDGTAFKTLFVRDGSGRMVRTESHQDGRLLSSSIYVYADKGALVRIEQQRADGTPGEPVQVRPKPNGGRVEIEHLAAPNEAEGEGTVGYDVTVAAPGARTRSTAYDAENRKLAVSFHDEEHRLVSSIRFTYNDAGWLLEESQTWGRMNLLQQITSSGQEIPEELGSALASLFGEGASGYQATYDYDGQGRQIVRRVSFGPLSASVERTEYNAQGDPSRITHESDHQEMRVGTGGAELGEPHPSVSATGYDYVYDDHGNWTRRTATILSGDPSARHETIETRRIEYFD